MKKDTGDKINEKKIKLREHIYIVLENISVSWDTEIFYRRITLRDRAATLH